MPETTEEYQKEFDLLIKQVQCKGMTFKIYFFKILLSKKKLKFVFFYENFEWKKVCLSNRSSILFLPCRHISVCPECARQLPEDICPLCRSPIEHMIDAFIS